MIRQLVLSVAAVLGLSAAALGQSVTLTINQPTQDTSNFQLNFTGTFASAEGWSVSSFQVVLISSTGLSKTYAGAGTGNGTWGATTTDAIAPGTYKAFVLAVGSRTNPTESKDYCSAIITVTCPQMVGTQVKVKNPTQPTNTYVTFTFNAGSPVRAGGVISGVASALPGTYQIPDPNPTNIQVGYDPDVAPVMNLLPVGGGEYFRITGQWGQNPSSTGSASVGVQQGSPLYNVYMHLSANRKEQNVIVDTQLIATEIKPNI